MLVNRFRAVQVKRDGDRLIVVQITAQTEVGDGKTGWVYEMRIWTYLYIIVAIAFSR
jgi:hypothetical protein